MENGETVSSPTLILTVGSRLRACAQKAITVFSAPWQDGNNLYLVYGSSLVYSREDQPGGEVEIKPIQPQVSIKPVKVSGLYDIDQLDIVKLKAAINVMWRDFREHNTRATVFSAEPITTRDQIVVLADAWDPDCSYLLIPVLYCLAELAIEADETEISVILDTSHFPNEAVGTNQEALVYRLFSEIEYRIDPNPRLVDDPVLRKLGFSDDLTLSDIHFFIVNEEKEGYLFANSHQEIEDIIFSFLMGFIDPSVMDSVLEGIKHENRWGSRNFFSSFGSVGMLVNPQAAIDYCGLKLSSHILQKGFLEELPADRQLIKHLNNEVVDNLGETNQWFQELVSNTEFGVEKIGESAFSVTYNLQPIPYESPQIDQIQDCSYISEVDRSYKINHDRLFGETDFLQSHIRDLTNTILESRKTAIYSILKQSDMLPGYMSNMGFVLKFIKNELENRLTSARKMSTEISDQSVLESYLQDKKNEFSTILKRFPEPPTWLKRIPEGEIKNLIRSLLRLLNAPKYLELDEARKGIEVAMVNLISEPFKKQLFEFNFNIADRSIKIVEELEKQLKEFEKILTQMNETFMGEFERHKTTLGSGDQELCFIYDPLNERVCDLLYDQFKPKITQISTDVVSESEWAKKLIEGELDNPYMDLLQYSTSHFLGIRDISLPQLIDKYAENKSPVDSFFPRLANFADRVLLLANLNTTSMGQNAQVTTNNSALVSSGGDYFWPTFFEHQSREWEKFTGVSAHIASFITAKHGFSLSAFENLLADGKTEWEGLSESEKLQYDIIPDKDKRPPRAKAELLHDSIWRITYNWSFTPSGSKKPSSFETSIEVDQTNYKNLVNRERFIGQYHLYAEENSPEIDQLVDYFKKIQFQYKWDSYDQASNVLAFVQSFISYRYDKDTRFVEEYPRYPLETLWDRVGDCEDFAILSGAILSRLGLKVALLLYPNPCHLAFGVETLKTHKVENLIKDPKYDVSYYYGEGTSKGWQLGDIPQDYHGATPDFYRINESSWLVTPEVKEPEHEPKTE